MVEQLFNQNWYRVADLRIHLKHHAKIHRHIYQGEIVYVLQDHVTGQFHRFFADTYQIIGLMDGKRTLQEIWELACEKLGDDMPTQNDIINLVSKLYNANVAVADSLPDIQELDIRRRDTSRKKFLQQIKSPLSIKIPLLDPENFLKVTARFVRPVFSATGIFIWLFVVLGGILLALMHWENLTSNLSDRVLVLENILLIGLTYPFVKVFHELAHAYSVKRWGGEVHEIGVMLLIFFPVPYVDATAATAFRNKYHRMLVGAAGILAEGFLAALAMILWTYTEPGAVRAVLFNVMFISGVSTLLFNGNPLLRFDAYYVLADFLEIPNLSTRSNHHIGYLVKRYILGVAESISTARTKNEAYWLASYSVLAFLYRLFITLAITLFVSSKYFIFGIIIGVWFIYIAVILPLMKVISKPLTDPQLKERSHKIYFACALGAGFLSMIIFLMPVPLATETEGVIWVSEQAQIYAEENGFIKKIVAGTNEYVEENETIISMENEDLHTKVRVLQAQVKEALALYEANITDKNLAEVLRGDYQYVLSQYERAKDRQKQLEIVARYSGTLIIPEHENLTGRFVGRGKILGYIVDYKKLPINVMVGKNDIERVINNTNDIEVRFVSHLEDVYAGFITRIMPAASKNLVSPVLSVGGGGLIALDPGDPNKSTTFQDYYHVEIEVPNTSKTTIDERVYVMFKHDAEPVFKRWYRVIRRVFLRNFGA